MPRITRRQFIGTALLAEVSLAISPTLAFASPADDKRAEAAAIAEQLAVWQRQLEIESDAYYQALDAHDAAVAAMEEAQGKVDAANAKIDTLTQHLSSRAVSTYRNGSYSLLDVLLGTATFTEFVETVSFIEDMNRADQQAIEEMRVARDEAQKAADEYAAAEQEAAAQLAKAEEVQANAAVIVGQYQAQLDSLDAEIAALVAEEQEAAVVRVAEEYGESPSQHDTGGGGGSTDPIFDTPAPVYTEPEPDPVYEEPDPEPTNPGNSWAADTIISAAYSQLGVPYVWGGSTPFVGLDCSGLVQYCYACAGIGLPRYSQSQRNKGYRVSLGNAQPGDILGNSHHVGIYIGGGAFIHAPDVGQVVSISYNMGQFDDATRIL